MRVFRTVHELQPVVTQLHRSGQSLGFVPTMGYLHEGHLSLVRTARQNNDRVSVSIFVNPTQFGPNEDLAKYPRDESRDLTLLEKEGVDFVLIPSVEEMYPPGFSTYVQPPPQAEGWCGATRPIHFRGVCTVVGILFNQVRPTRAYFGQKDAQQATVIKQMVRDLHFPVEIHVCPIVREPDGLAMSSRNFYLSPEQRQSALVLSQTLTEGLERYRRGETDSELILQAGFERIATSPGVKMDYLGIVDPTTFRTVNTVTSGCIHLGAIFVGSTRLIDNMIFL